MARFKTVDESGEITGWYLLFLIAMAIGAGWLGGHVYEDTATIVFLSLAGFSFLFAALATVDCETYSSIPLMLLGFKSCRFFIVLACCSTLLTVVRTAVQ